MVLASRKYAKQLVYTGPIDEYFEFCYGKLDWRTVSFKEEILDMQRKRAFRERQAAKEKYEEKRKIVEAITYAKHLDKRKAEEKLADPKAYEALFGRKEE